MNESVTLRDRFPGKGFDGMMIVGRQGQFFPHWELKNAIYHVSFHLEDSLPKSLAKKIKNERIQMEESVLNAKGNISPFDIYLIKKYYSKKMEGYFDNGYGSCIFRDNENAQIMQNVIMNGNGVEYDLYAWCIMPNHVHLMFSLLGEYVLSKVVATWKSCSAHYLNKRMNTKGRLWNVDYFNRIIRDGDDYSRTKEYIWRNPEKAGLHDWPWRWMLQDL